MGIKKGIILAGGVGSRLSPATNIINKHLLTVYDKFIIDYPINTLKKLGCTHITVVLGGPHFDQVVAYLKDGKEHGVIFNYVFQGNASGISQALNLCKPYVENEDTWAVCLGDNCFQKPINITDDRNCARIMLYKHKELNRFGVASVKDDKIIRIEEKPKTISNDCDNYAITGCYVFNKRYFEYFEKTKPSNRGEWEITDIIQQYANDNDLHYSLIDGFWSDLGLFESIDSVRQLIKTEPVEF